MKIFRLLALLLLPTVAAMGQYSVTRTYLNVVQQAGLQFTTPVLGDATGTSFNGNFFTAGTYTLSGTAGKTLNFTNTVTLTGTDGTTMTFPGTSATVARIDAGQTFVGMNTFPGLTLTGSVITTRTAMPALAVNFNLPEQTYSGNGPQTFTYANNTAGEATRVILTASGGTLTPTIPSTFSYVQNTAITTLGVIASGNEMIVDILWTGARFEIIGDPVLVTGGGTAFLQVAAPASDGQTLRSTGSGTAAFETLTEEICKFQLNGDSGGAIATGTVPGTSRIKGTFTLTGWSITGTAASGTNTIKIWKIASGTAIPTIADVINTSGVSLATGTAVSSTTVTDFTSLTFTDGEMVRCAVTAADGTTTQLNVVLFGIRTS